MIPATSRRAHDSVKRVWSTVLGSLRSASDHVYNALVNYYESRTNSNNRLATYCSGTEGPMLAHEALGEVVETYTFCHDLSVEKEIPKQEYIKDFFGIAPKVYRYAFSVLILSIQQ